MIEHLRLGTLFGRFSWKPLLRISSDYYPDLVHEFYANILHKVDKDFSSIISTVKGECTILDKEHLASILGIRDEENTTTVDSNRKRIDEDLD